MKTVDLATHKLDLHHIIEFAASEPVLLLTGDGKEFIVSPADDFEAEVEALRSSQSFQAFLDRRMESQERIPLDEIEREIDEDLRREERAARPPAS